jgi:hypothetical protein
MRGDNPNVVSDSRSWTQSWASSINEKRDISAKLRCERLEIGDKWEEKKYLSDIDCTFKIIERDNNKHANILKERKLKQGELKRLNWENNSIFMDYQKI